MVYYDVNKLFLPEYSFPAKAVVNMMASNLNIIPMIILLRIPIYNITPHTHTELLSMIIFTCMETLQNKLKMLLQYLFGQTVI